MDNPRNVVRPIAKVSDEDKAKKKAPELRAYLICFMYTDESTSWVEVIGRSEAYDTCKTNIVSGDIDLDRSIVLVEGGEFGKHASLYEFMKHMEMFFSPEYAKDGFDIEDYVVGDSESSPEYGNTDYDVQTPIDVTHGGIIEGEDI